MTDPAMVDRSLHAVVNNSTKHVGVLAVVLSLVCGVTITNADLLRIDDGSSHTIATVVDLLEIANKSIVTLDRSEATSVSINDSRFVILDSVVSNDIDAINNSVIEIGGTDGAIIGGHVNASDSTITVMNTGELGDGISLRLGSHLVVQDGGRVGDSGTILSALDSSSIVISNGGTARFTATQLSGSSSLNIEPGAHVLSTITFNGTSRGVIEGEVNVIPEDFTPGMQLFDSADVTLSAHISCHSDTSKTAVEAYGTSHLDILGGLIEGIGDCDGVFATDIATVTIRGGNIDVRRSLFAESTHLSAAGDSVVTIYGSQFNYPLGQPILDRNGILTGTLEDGTEISWLFRRADNATLLLVPEPDMTPLSVILMAALVFHFTHFSPQPLVHAK